MIYLVRHCTPQIDYSRCNYREAVKRLREYDSTPKIDRSEIEALSEEVGHIRKIPKLQILSSTRPRSIKTAKALFRDKIYSIDSKEEFVEFDLRIVKLPLIKLGFRKWLLLSRFLWFIGFTGGAESCAEEIARAKNCALTLIEAEKKMGNVILVSHGLLNCYIEKELTRNRYDRVYKKNSGNFTIVKLSALRPNTRLKKLQERLV